MPHRRQSSSSSYVDSTEPSVDHALHPTPAYVNMMPEMFDSFKALDAFRQRVSQQRRSPYPNSYWGGKQSWNDGSQYVGTENQSWDWDYSKGGFKGSSKGGFKGSLKGSSKGSSKRSSSRTRSCSRVGRSQDQTSSPNNRSAFVHIYEGDDAVLRCVFCKKDSHEATIAYIESYLEKHRGVEVLKLMTEMGSIFYSGEDQDDPSPHSFGNTTFWSQGTKLDSGNEPQYVVKIPDDLALIVTLHTIRTAIASFKAKRQQRVDIFRNLRRFNRAGAKDASDRGNDDI